MSGALPSEGWQLASTRADLWPAVAAVASSSDSGFGSNSNGSASFINSLKFAESKSIRTSFVILASFNAVTGALTAFGVCWDCYKAAKRRDPDFTIRSSIWSLIGPAEAFPLALSCSIVVQGIVFAVVQSKGLEALLILGCTSLSQILLPAFFIVPFIQFTFGIEATIQAARPHLPFSPRSKWDIPTCLLLTVGGLIGCFVEAKLVELPNFCFAGLMWLLRHWSLGCFVILVVITGSLVIGSLLSFYRLRKVSGIAEVQRTTASWMASYMALGAVMMALMIPFFYAVSTDMPSYVKRSRNPLMMATTVVANLTGLATASMYLLLRCSRLGKIRPKGFYSEFDTRKSYRPPRAAGPPSLIFTKQMAQPVPLPSRHREAEYESNSVREIIDMEKGMITRTETPNKPASETNGIPEQTEAAAQEETESVATSAAAPSVAAPDLTRKASYGFFPRRDPTYDISSTYLLPSAAYKPESRNDGFPVDPFVDELFLPPPPVRFSTSGPRHHRDSSYGTSASVPIGLRVSNIEDMSRVDSYYEIPQRPVARDSITKYIPAVMVPAPAVPRISSPAPPPRSRKDKQLPPVPLLVTKQPSVKAKKPKKDEDEITLTSAVYSPVDRERKTQASNVDSGQSRGTPVDDVQVRAAEWI